MTSTTGPVLKDLSYLRLNFQYRMVGLKISLKWIYPAFCVLNSNQNTSDLTPLLSNYLSTHPVPKLKHVEGRDAFPFPVDTNPCRFVVSHPVTTDSVSRTSLKFLPPIFSFSV
jgi:hypothetical protein